MKQVIVITLCLAASALAGLISQQDTTCDGTRDWICTDKHSFKHCIDYGNGSVLPIDVLQQCPTGTACTHDTSQGSACVEEVTCTAGGWACLGDVRFMECVEMTPGELTAVGDVMFCPPGYVCGVSEVVPCSLVVE